MSCEALGFDVAEDPVGTLVARNRPPGEPVFGVGSHCDSNRNGGRYDGTMGVVTALEVCRLSSELGLDLPLQLISFLEEEGSGYGQMLLGSRIMLQRVKEDDLRERFRAIDDGRSFWEHARGRGVRARAVARVIHVLDDLTGWIEMHIEQAVSCRTRASESASSMRSPATSTRMSSCSAAATMPVRHP